MTLGPVVISNDGFEIMLRGGRGTIGSIIRARPSVCPPVCQLFSIPRPNSKTTGQNRIKLSTMKEYILKLCTKVLVLSYDQN